MDEPTDLKRMKLSRPSKDDLLREQQDNHITIVILNKSWKLDKAMLKQSSYFDCMFSGSWKEPENDVINIPIGDDNITLDSVAAVLSYLDNNEPQLGPDNVISILATATFLQVQNLIDECSKTMIKNFTSSTVMLYYNTATTYVVPSVKKKAIEWLETNLIWLSTSTTDISFLKEISVELMNDIVTSPNLVVCGCEKTLYQMLLQWLAVHNGKTEDESVEEFYNRQNWPEPFLTTKEGSEYKLPFQSLKVEHLIAYDTVEKFIKNENVLPKEWISSSYEKLWKSVASLHLKRGSRYKAVKEEEFEKDCLRFGFYFKEKPPKDRDLPYQYDAFHYSMDFSICLDEDDEYYYIMIGRPRYLGSYLNDYETEYEGNLCVAIKATALSIDEGRNVIRKEFYKKLDFSLHSAVNWHDIFTYEYEQLPFPLYLSVEWIIALP